jgi:hypothetical protein
MNLYNVLLENGIINADITFEGAFTNTVNTSYFINNLQNSNININSKGLFTNSSFDKVINNIYNSSLNIQNLNNVNALNILNNISNSKIYINNTVFTGNNETNAFENINETTVVFENVKFVSYLYAFSNCNNITISGFSNISSNNIKFNSIPLFNDYIKNNNYLYNSSIIDTYSSINVSNEQWFNTYFDIRRINFENNNINLNTNDYNCIVNVSTDSIINISETDIDELNVNNCTDLNIWYSNISNLNISLNEDIDVNIDNTTIINNYTENVNTTNFEQPIDIQGTAQINFNSQNQNLERLPLVNSSIYIINTRVKPIYLSISNSENVVLNDNVNEKLIESIFENDNFEINIGKNFADDPILISNILPYIYSISNYSLITSNLSIINAENVKYIDDNAFTNTSGIVYLNLSSCINNPLNLEQFSNSSDTLEYLNINNVKEITGTLNDFEKLQILNANSLSYIYTGTFENCRFETITTISNVSGLYIPNIISISNDSFKNNTNLKNIYLLNPMIYPANPFTNCNPVNISINCNASTGISYFQNINSIKAFTSISNLSINDINNILLNSSNNIEYLEINSINL